MGYFRSQLSALPSSHKKFSEPGKVQLHPLECFKAHKVEVTEGKRKFQALMVRFRNKLSSEGH